MRFEKCDILFSHLVCFLLVNHLVRVFPRTISHTKRGLTKLYSEKPTNTTRLLNTSSLFVEVRHFDNFYFVYFSVAKNFSEKLSKREKLKTDCLMVEITSQDKLDIKKSLVLIPPSLINITLYHYITLFYTR